MISLKKQWKNSSYKDSAYNTANTADSDGKGGGRKGILLPAALLCIGAAFVYLGVSRGEMGVVLVKAINICLECIGIG